MEDIEILNRFLKCNINIHPLALQELKQSAELIDKIISEAQHAKDKPAVITPEYISSIRNKEVVIQKSKKKIAEEYSSEFRIKKDITKKSYSEGSTRSFLEYFNDRYERLSKILKERNDLREAMPIELAKSYRSTVKIIGMVNDIKKTQKGHIQLELEDPTGTISVIILNSNHEMFEAAGQIVMDEVIGVGGNFGKNGEIVIAREIFFPDLPVKKELKKSQTPLAIAMISDIHIGSGHFLENTFLKFIKWLNCELGSKKQVELAEKVKYLLIAGDVVDGVGIYPGQENDLIIKDIFEQYKKAAEFFKMLPEHVEVIISPGNHDATRIGEPQPAILNEFAERLYQSPQIHMVGNPCLFQINDVDVLIYHGTSLLEIISVIPGLDVERPQEAMEKLLKSRHLVPTFGGRTQIVPEMVDYLTIDDVPDIFHTGHVHTMGVSNYRGVTMINSGTFQSETEYQKKQGLKPTPGRVPVLDLSTHNTTILNFI